MNRTSIVIKIIAPMPHNYIWIQPFAKKYWNDASSHISRCVSAHIPDIKELFQGELISSFNNDREKFRKQIKESIKRILRENKLNYDKKRKESSIYRNLVVIYASRRVLNLIRINTSGPMSQSFCTAIVMWCAELDIMRDLFKHRLQRDYMKPWIDNNAGIKDVSKDEDEEEESERSRQ